MSEKKQRKEEQVAPQIQIVTVGHKGTPDVNKTTFESASKDQKDNKQDKSKENSSSHLIPPTPTRTTRQTAKQQQQRNRKQSDEGQQDDESHEQSEQNGESNVSKQSKFEQRESGQAKQVPSSRKCFNKLCVSKKIFKKIRSRVEENKYRFFCKSCYDNYYNNLYCEYCEQIYSNNADCDDDDKWIGCDNCDRWNHIDCEKRFSNRNVQDLKDKNQLYQCRVCSSKNRPQDRTKKPQDKEIAEDKIVQHRRIDFNKTEKISIFHKKAQLLPTLQLFLQTYSFKIWINQNQVREDIDTLRNICMRTQQAKKLMKKVKQI